MTSKVHFFFATPVIFGVSSASAHSYGERRYESVYLDGFRDGAEAFEKWLESLDNPDMDLAREITVRIPACRMTPAQMRYNEDLKKIAKAISKPGSLSCGHECHWLDGIGFCPEAGCPVHDPERAMK